MALVETVVSMLILAVAALAVASTMLLVNSPHRRAAGGSSLDLQAASCARDTLDQLKNNVSTNEAAGGAGEPLVVRAAPYVTTAGLPANLLAVGGTRSYTVSDVMDATGHPTGLKKVTVTVQWND